MPPKRDDPDALEIAHVLFMDIVGYSRLSLVKQAYLLHRLQQIVGGTKAFRRAKSCQQLISLPTGDGMALVFFLDPVAPVRCAMEVSRLLKREQDINLRIGLHSGPVLRIADINKNKNVAGGGINTAQRVMDCGEGGHILVSKAVADLLTHLGNFEGYLHDWGEIQVKHGERLHVFSLCFEDLGKAEPPAKLITLPPAGRPLAQESNWSPRVTAQEPNFGPLVHKLCDRSAQVNAFTESLISNFKQYRGVPQFYFIHGEEKECHDSLIDRLVNTQIKHLAEKYWGSQKGVVLLKKVPWVYDGSMVARQRGLCRILFSEFDPSYMEDDLSAAALRRLVGFTLCPVVVIRCNIYAAYWDKFSKELLEWYLAYWSEVAGNPSSPQFVIFINVIYPKPPVSRWWKGWFTQRRFKKERIKRDLIAVSEKSAASYRCEVLKELATPRQHEIVDWFSLYNIYDEKRQSELVAQLFSRASEPLSMADIEHELKHIHQRFVKERVRL